ncbi:MAG: hypothetical protein MI802_10890 [Desulfobacterales bacterium]|nr:hypothetical protein [Desulfobacterales bacterium]
MKTTAATTITLDHTLCNTPETVARGCPDPAGNRGSRLLQHGPTGFHPGSSAITLTPNAAAYISLP